MEVVLLNHDYSIQERVLEAEGKMVDLLHSDWVYSDTIPYGYQKAWRKYPKNTFKKGDVVKMSKADFHAFYNWLRETDQSEPQI